MSFLNPAGLWLLLGVPVLIIIYLIKAQHEDRAVSSTYIWKLSNRFLKKRLPLQRFRKIILFLLQIFMIITAALMVSRPAIVNGESCAYIAILDASASMQVEDEEGNSRFERAIQQIEELAGQIKGGHTLSVILASDRASYLVQETDSVNEVKVALKKAECSLTSCDVEEALEVAKVLCDRTEKFEVIFFTDCEYKQTNGLTVVNLNQKEWNVSVENMTSEVKNKDTEFTATLVSYHQDSIISVGLRIDGNTVDAKQVELLSDAQTTVTFTVNEVTSFDTAEIYIEEADGLVNDNSYSICQNEKRTYSVLLVSESPLYLESALNALGTCDVKTVSSIEDAELKGYELYIFDQVAPKVYPADGSIILFGTQGLPEEVSVKTVIEKEAPLSTREGVNSELYDNLSLGETVVSKYGDLVANAEWETLLTCDETAVLVSTKLTDGMTCSVISFDLHNSNLPMQMGFLVFMDNLVEYSVPAFLKETDFAVGETVEFTVMPSAKEIHVEFPDGSIKNMSTEGKTCVVATDETGIYTAVMKDAESGGYVDFFVHLAKGEISLQTGGTLELETNISQADGVEKEAFREIWFWLALALLLLLLIEWGFYYHEQY